MGHDPPAMKWWGWGDESVEFDMASRPALREYVRRMIHVDVGRPGRPRIGLDSIELPARRINQAFLEEACAILRPDQMVDSKLARLTHGFGKSARDMWRVREGIVPYAPDLVIHPESAAQVRALVDLACRRQVVLIPFGGGSNIAGCLEPLGCGERMCVSLDMRRMDRVISIDKESCVARIEAGALGPRMEEQLNKEGFTLGHFPDSFLFSTVGGWVATRSAGMQSDRYGKIEDMVVSVRMATPSGDVETLTVPRASNGIDVNHLCIGSEGTLGVITEIALRVHRVPQKKAAYGYLFRDFETGLNAMLACHREDAVPAMMRLNDPHKTALSAAYANSPGAAKRVLSKVVRQYLKRIRRWNPEKICLALTGYEGSARRFDAEREAVEAIFRRHGAFRLGEGPGRSFNEGKFDFPYLRDYLFERDILCDVSETASVWSNLLPLYRAVNAAMEAAFAAENVTGWVGCHASHSYPTGASLYFTFAYAAGAEDQMQQFLRIKKTSLDTFLAHGATLSHHHAVGYEHMPWLERDVSPGGVAAMRAIKSGLDPNNIMNPGRLTGGLDFAEWRRTGLPQR